MKKIIKLTESDLTNIVKRVIAEQGIKGVQGTLAGADPNYIRALRREIPNNKFQVTDVLGNVLRNKNNQKLTKGMFISENEPLTFSPGSRVYFTLAKNDGPGKNSPTYYKDYQFFVEIGNNKLVISVMGW